MVEQSVLSYLQPVHPECLDIVQRVVQSKKKTKDLPAKSI